MSSVTIGTFGSPKETTFDGKTVKSTRDGGDTMTLSISSISEVDSAGDLVGSVADNFVDKYGVQTNFAEVPGVIYPLHQLSLADASWNMSDPTTVTYNGIKAQHVSYMASMLNETATVQLDTYVFQESGTITNYDEQVPVTNGTTKVNIEVAGWPFCEENGEGFNRCMHVPQNYSQADVLVPHTVLVPLCEGDNNVAQLVFHCVGDSRCNRIAKTWFFFGTSERVQNFAAWNVTQQSQDSNYYLTITTKMLQDYLKLDALVPGDSYNFYTVYGFEDDETPQLDTQQVDWGLKQVWQCPKTIISDNYQVGAYLDVTLNVAGESEPSLMDCSGSSNVRRRRLSETPSCKQGQVYSLGDRARLTMSTNSLLDSVNSKLKSGYPKVDAKTGDYTMRFGKFSGSLMYDPVLDYDMSESGSTGLSSGGSIAIAVVVCGVVIAALAGGFVAARRRRARRAKAPAAAGAAKPVGAVAAGGKAPTATNSPIHPAAKK